MKRWYMFCRASHLFMVSILLVVSSFSTASCASNQNEGENLPSIAEEPEKGSDKLDSRLLGLIDAEKRGETESFARMAGFDLVDGSVRVVIDYVSGQLDAAVKAAERFGTVEAIAYRAEKVQALIPITSLTALAREESISRIREPEKVSTN